MVKLSEIEKFLCYSIQCNGYYISQELNLKMDSGIIKVLRNNFSRFWNLLSKEQRMKYIKLSVFYTLDDVSIKNCLKNLDK